MEFNEVLIVSGEGMIRFAYLLFVTIAIVVGNALVIVAVGKFKKLRRTTNIMLASLAVADLLVGLVTVPLYIAWTMHPDAFDRSAFLCRAALLSSLLVVAASQINLILLSVERYLAVCAPFRHRALLFSCPWIHFTVICVVWAVSLTTTGLASLAIKPDYTMCNYYRAFNRWFLFFAVIFGIFIPFIAITFMNIKVFLSVLRYEKRRKSFVGDHLDCVRQVSDSSDQEIRVSIHKGSSKHENKSRVLTLVKSGLCCRSFEERRVLSPYRCDNSDDDVFLPSERYTPTDSDDGKVTLSPRPKSFPTYDVEEGVTKENIDSVDAFCEIKLKNVTEYSYNETANGIKDRHFEREFIPTYHWHTEFSQMSSDKEDLTDISKRENAGNHYEGSLITGHYKESSCTNDLNVTRKCKSRCYLRSCTANNYCDEDITETDHSKFPSFSCDSLPLLDSVGILNRVKYSSSPSHQTKFRQKIFKGIEMLATPRILRRKEVTHTTQDASSPYNTLKSEDTLVPRLRLTCSNDVLESGGVLESLASGNEFLGQDVGASQDVADSISMEHFDDDNGDQRIPLLSVSPHLEDVPRTKSLRNLTNDFYPEKLAGKSPIYLHGIKPSKSLDFGDGRSNMEAENRGRSTRPKQWLSDNFQFDSDQSYPIHADASWLKSNPNIYPSSTMTKDDNIQHLKSGVTIDKVITRSMCFGKGVKDGACHFYSTLDIGGNSSSKLISHSRNLARGKSESDLCSIDDDVRNQIHFQRRSSETLIKLFEIPKLQTQILPQKRVRQISHCPNGDFSRKISSGRESGSTQIAYVSKKVARTVSIVCFSFILAWLPFFAVIIVNTFCAKCNLVYFLNAVLMITFAQSASNPIIYALCHVTFRTAYKNLFSQMCQKVGILK